MHIDFIYSFIHSFTLVNNNDIRHSGLIVCVTFFYLLNRDYLFLNSVQTVSVQKFSIGKLLLFVYFGFFYKQYEVIVKKGWLSVSISQILNPFKKIQLSGKEIIYFVNKMAIYYDRNV